MDVTMKQQIKKYLPAITVFLLALTAAFTCAVSAAIDGESARETTELYSGVTRTHISLSASSKYGQQEIWVIEFDPKQENLAFDVTMGATYSNQLRSVRSTVAAFNASNTEGKTAIAAVNGDLWMVSSAHARVEGGNSAALLAGGVHSSATQ